MVAHKSSAQQVTWESPAQHRRSTSAPGATLLTLTSPSTLHRPRCLRSQTSSATSPFGFKRHQGHSARSPVAHLDEPIYPAQAKLPQESDQLRLHHHLALNATKATAPGAQLLTLMSPSTLYRLRYLGSQTSSGYIAIWL